MALTKVTGDFIETGSITQGHLHSSHGITLDHIGDGSTNTFFTTADARSAISATGSLSYNNSTGVMSFTMPTLNTTNITEGDKLFFTNARAIGALTAGTNITISGSTISSTDTNTTYSVGDGGLTQNNFTNTLKTKLDGIATSANNYSLPFTDSSANWNTAYGWGNHASAGYLTSHQSLSGYLPLGGGTLTGNLNTSGNANHIIIGGVASNNHYNTVTSTTGLSFGGGNDFTNYSIGTTSETFGGNYTKLNIKWHTGIRFFAMNQYGGVRFYSDVGLTTKLFSIGEGDAHVRVSNNLYVTGTVTGSNLSGTNTGDQTNISGNAGTATTASSLAANTSPTIQVLNFTGVGGNSGNANQSYAIYQEGGAWSNPYPDLCIGYHTGIKIGAHYSYNGIRFYNNSDMATEIFSVGNGDNHVRVANDLYVAGSLFSGGSAVITTSNYSSYALPLSGGTITGTLTLNVNASSTITLTSAGTNASYIKAGAGDELYIGGNDSWQMRFNGGNVLMDNGGYLQNNVSIRSPIFYDYNNTAYYVDPASYSSMWGVAVRGDLDSTGTGNQIFFWSSGNQTTSAIGFKANGGNFTNPTGNGDGYNTYFTMDTINRGWVFRRGTGGTNFTSAYTSGWILNNGSWQANANMKAPIFYDSANTGYYLDPASTSNVNVLQTAGTISCAGGITTGVSADIKRTGINNTKYISLSGHLSGYGVNDYPTLKTNFHVLYFDAGGVYTGYITSTGGFTDQSDRSLKENIEDIPDALSKVMNLRGRYFTWINELQGNERQVGFIAQEVEEQLPEVVSVGAGDTKGVAYGKVTALLVNAMKEQQAQIELLKQEVELLKQ